MAIVISCTLFNLFCTPQLPLVEVSVFVLHIVGVFVVIIPLWVMAPKSGAFETILSFTNEGGWSTLGLATMIGITPMIGMLIVS